VSYTVKKGGKKRRSARKIKKAGLTEAESLRGFVGNKKKTNRGQRDKKQSSVELPETQDAHIINQANTTSWGRKWGGLFREGIIQFSQKEGGKKNRKGLLCLVDKRSGGGKGVAGDQIKRVAGGR